MKIIRFPIYVLGSLILLSLTIVGVWLWLWRIQPEDRETYYKLMADSNPALIQEANSSPYTAKQQRKGIQKDIYFMHGNERLHLCLKAHEADLVLDRQVEGMEMREHMRDVECWVQEELLYRHPDGSDAVKSETTSLLLPFQKVRYCKANTAIYSYKNDQLKAEHVTVATYILPGHVLIEDMSKGVQLMYGIADSVEFSLAGGNPSFKAHHLKAKISKQARDL